MYRISKRDVEVLTVDQGSEKPFVLMWAEEASNYSLCSTNRVISDSICTSEGFRRPERNLKK